MNKKKKNILFWSSIAIIIVFIVMILAVSLPKIGASVYGDRLNGEANYVPSDTTINEIKDDLKKVSEIKSVEYENKTRILNFTIDVADGVSQDTASSYLTKITSHLSEDQLKYFDIQVFFVCTANENSTVFPLVAYSHRGASFSFNKNNPVESSVSE